jgi:hypothetical protein
MVEDLAEIDAAASASAVGGLTLWRRLAIGSS